ncbi:MAG: radical SAM protein [Candidatus Eisenbacteria bacterium]|nr:radical SAM protein [Candidatus Eisenbacteria bacterium]
MHHGRPQPRYGAELRAVASEAAAALGAASYARRGEPLGATMARGGMLLLMPFLLLEALPSGASLGSARTMALANAFGAAHFLLQDRLIDEDERLDPEACRFSDLSLALFLRELSGLFDATSALWRHLDRHVAEYFESLAWERAVLRTPRGRDAVTERELPASLRQLGLRLSPLKTSAVGMAMLAGRDEWVGALEQIVVDYHAAYQITDDLADLADDSAAGRWSVPLWMIAERLGMAEPPRGASTDALTRLAVECGVIDASAALIDDGYGRARAGALALDASALAEHLERARGDTLSRLRWESRRRVIALRAGAAGAGGEKAAADGRLPAVPTGDVESAGPGAASPRLHAFDVAGEGFVVDPGSAMLFRADAAALDTLLGVERGAKAPDLAVLEMNHGRRAVREVLDEAARLVPPPEPERPVSRPAPGVVASLALHVSGGCNLSCDYCYLRGSAGGLMSEEVALRALDLLFEESVGAPHLSVVFFGGEPLLHPALIEVTARHARTRATAEGRALSLHVTTNGTLLTPEVASRLAAVGAAVMVSIDGDRLAHDAHRRFPDGGGSYDAIARNLSRLPATLRVSARTTVTEATPRLRDLVEHLVGLGAGTVHLSPVSGAPLSSGFAARVCAELDDLAAAELDRVRSGRAPVVANFAEAIRAIAQGHPRVRGCGAGATYVSVAADGTLGLCHRFSGEAAYVVGDVDAGLDRPAVSRLLGLLSDRAAACGNCWARWVCGGPCLYDLVSSPADACGESATRCRIKRRVLELSMWLHASLPPPARGRLEQCARTNPRPEVAGCADPRHGAPDASAAVPLIPMEIPWPDEGG